MADGNILAPFQPKNHDHGKCVAEAIAAAERRCARDGRSFTPLRRRVLELVWSNHGPVGAYELLDALRVERRGAAPPTISPAPESPCSAWTIVGWVGRVGRSPTRPRRTLQETCVPGSRS